MDPWTEWQHTRMLWPMFMEPWAATKKALTSQALALLYVIRQYIASSIGK
jgi:hypothetical protein